MTAAYRSLLIRCLAVAGALVGVAVSSAPQPEDEVYAITDVRVTDNRQAVRDSSSFLPGHTGVTRHHVTLPYVPGDPATRGRRRTAYDVNRGIGGSTTTIWVKYERLPRTSSMEVLADIAVAHWTHWRYDAPDGEFTRAGGLSGGIPGALTTGTKGSCWRNGLVVKFKPLKDISTWVLDLYLHCTQNNVPWVPSIDTIEGIPVTAQRAGIDIHRGCGGSYYFLIKLSATTSLPTHGRTYVWRDIHEGDFHGGYRQIRAFHYAGRAFLLGSKLEGDPPRRVFYVSRVSPDGQGWTKNMRTFDLPRCSDEVRWPRQSWAVFYLDDHPYLAAMHRYDDQWRCRILKYKPDAATFQVIGETGFTNWHPTYREQPYIIPLQLDDDAHLLVGSSEQPEQAFRVYRIRDVYKADDADTAAIEDTWEHAVDFGEAGRLDVPSMMRLETIAAFQLDDATYLFGLSHDTNKASIWRLNDETWTFTKTADAPFPAETVLVVAFHADDHPYLFSLDRERKTGNIWRINDGADGWERVYWADHRVRSADTGYYRRACTIFELYGHPHMFIQWWTHLLDRFASSPHGRMLAFAYQGESAVPFVAALDRPASPTRAQVIARSPVSATDFCWLEDSQHLLLADGGAEGYVGSGLNVVEAATGNGEVLLPHPYGIYQVAYSAGAHTAVVNWPDGDAYTSRPPWTRDDVCLVDMLEGRIQSGPDSPAWGSGITAVARFPGQHVVDLQLGGGANTVYVLAEHDSRNLYRVTRDGSQTVLGEGVRDFAVWSPAE